MGCYYFEARTDGSTIVTYTVTLDLKGGFPRFLAIYFLKLNLIHVKEASNYLKMTADTPTGSSRRIDAANSIPRSKGDDDVPLSFRDSAGLSSSSFSSWDETPEGNLQPESLPPSESSSMEGKKPSSSVPLAKEMSGPPRSLHPVRVQLSSSAKNSDMKER